MKKKSKIVLRIILILILSFVAYFLMLDYGNPLRFLQARVKAYQFVNEHCEGEDYQVIDIEYSGYNFLFPSPQKYFVSLEVPHSLDKHFSMTFRDGELVNDGYYSILDGSNTEERIRYGYNDIIDSSFGVEGMRSYKGADLSFNIDWGFNIQDDKIFFADGNPLVIDEPYDIMELARKYVDITIKVYDIKDNKQLAETISYIESVFNKNKIECKNLDIIIMDGDSFILSYEDSFLLKSSHVHDARFYQKVFDKMDKAEQDYYEFVEKALEGKYSVNTNLGIFRRYENGGFMDKHSEVLYPESIDIYEQALHTGTVVFEFEEMSAEDLAQSLTNARRLLVENGVPVTQIDFNDGEKKGIGITFGTPLFFDEEHTYRVFYDAIIRYRELEKEN